MLGQIDRQGYIRIWGGQRTPAGKRKYVHEHRVIAQKALGRALKSSEEVHHWNEDKTDNRNRNLLICTASYHCLIHKRMAAKGLEIWREKFNRELNSQPYAPADYVAYAGPDSAIDEADA